MLSYFVPYNIPKNTKSYDKTIDQLLKETFEPFEFVSHSNVNSQFKTYEASDFTAFKVNLPDIDRDDVKINVFSDEEKRKWLSIEVSKEEKAGDEKGSSYSRSFYKFSKHYLLDESKYVIKKIQATFKDGLLQVKLPKNLKRESDPYRLEINIQGIEDVPTEQTVESKTNPVSESKADSEETVTVVDA